MLDVAALNEEGVLPWEKWSVGRDLVPGRDVPGQWLHEFDKITSLLAGPLTKKWRIAFIVRMTGSG